MGGYLALEVRCDPSINPNPKQIILILLKIIKQAPERVTHLALISTQARADSLDTQKRREEQISFVQKQNSVKPLARPQYTQP